MRLQALQFIKMLVIGILLALLAGCPAGAEEARSCADRPLSVGFYAYFEPVSFSADPDPDSEGFNTHLGYEADLLTALEAMEGLEVSFSRKGIAPWDDIWLLSATSEYDIVGGGITILDARTRDSSGREAVVFTSGHTTFRQSLLVRSKDVNRLATYRDLTADVRVGALADTTGEARLLELTGLVNEDGVLASGFRVDTPEGTVVADGSSSYFITAAGESENLAGRTHLYPPSEDMPQVVYHGGQTGEEELLDALSDGTVDAVARGEIGNRKASSVANNGFVVTALDEVSELGGFTLDVKDSALASCLSERIDWLIDNGNIGYKEWLEDPAVFMQRARLWGGMS